MFVLLLVAAVILGFVVGVICVRTSIRNERLVGTLRVDNSDPDDVPYLFLELTSNPEVIKQRKYVTLKVDVKNYLSQK